MSFKKRLSQKPKKPEPPKTTSQADHIPQTVLIQRSPDAPKDALARYEDEIRAHYKDEPEKLQAALARIKQPDFLKKLTKELS